MGFFDKLRYKNDGGDQDKWKVKYLNLLDAQEQAEKEVKLNQDILGKTITRLSILVSDKDPQLEPQLQSIREHIKKGIVYSQLKTDLDNLTAAINKLDIGKPGTSSAAEKEEALLFDFLRQHYNADKQQVAFASLQKSYQGGDKQKLFAAIAEIIQENTTPKNPANPGSLQPVPSKDIAPTDPLNRLETVEPITSGSEREDVLLFDFLRQHYCADSQRLELDLLQKSYQHGGDTQKLYSTLAEIIKENFAQTTPVNPIDQDPVVLKEANVPSYIGTKLAQLLKKIEIPEGFVDKAELLQQQLENSEQADSFEHILDRVNALLIEISAKTQSKEEEIDRFLTHITKELTDLGLTVAESNLALMDASLNRSKLDDSVSEQMNDLQNRSSNATQLEPLKQVISSHIEKITNEIQEHKQKEAVQREKYQHQLDELGQKIKSMEMETGKLQSKLITAHTNAQRDVLTDLPNRLAYDERTKMEIARWQRYHTPLCLVIWDIDFFKKFNDQHGHQTGDKVLEHVAAIFTNNIRRADFIARFGGEEFVMLLPHTNRHSAVKVAEKLRQLIEDSPLLINSLSLSITISCGITQFLKGDDHETAFTRADMALYRAKELGRNQCQTG